MIDHIRSFYRNFLTTGLPENAVFKEKVKVELSNQFIFLGLLCVFAHNLVNLLFLRSLVDFCLTMVWFIILAPALGLNLAKKPSAARIYLALGGLSAVFVLHLLFGPELKLESMYILFLVIGTLFFESKARLIYAILVLVLFISASIINTSVEPIFASLVRPSGSFTRFIFSVAMISALIGKLVLENREYNTVINGQNEYLNKYNKQLKSFNYIVSHDLKEPLRGIVGFSQLIKRRHEQGKEVDDKYFDIMIRSTKQLNKLVNDLNDFTTSEERELSKEELRIDAIVDEIRTSLLEESAQDNIEISCQPFPVIVSSKLALTITLRNIIENGIKYNDNKIRKVIVEGEIIDNMATIKIADNGIGIEEKYFEEVFVLFERLHATYEKGSGLGLNISQNLMHRLGGNISISSSKLGVGTTFLLKFPITAIVTKSSPKESILG